MKSIFTLLLLVLISSMGIKAQKAILVSEDSLSFGKGHLPGLTVVIPEVKYETFLKAWTKELQSGTKSKLVTENNEMSIFGAKIKDISQNPINVYSKLMNLDSTLKLTVAFEVKKDQYMERSSGETELTKAKQYLKEFAKNQYIGLAKEEADAEDKKLREVEKELSSLEKEKTRMQKSIQSNNTTIANEKENITIQNNEMTSVSAAIIEHNKQLDTMTTGPAKDEKVKYIKDLEKRKKKAESSIESSQNKINKANDDINKTNAEIPKNEKMQEQVIDKKDKQQAVYDKFADKIKKIKSF
jgi:chromosome segregation ATPase